MKKKNKNYSVILTALIAALVVVIATSIVIVVINNSSGTNKKYTALLEDAKSYINAGDYDAAITECWSAIAENDSDADAYITLGEIYERNGDNANAYYIYSEGYSHTYEDIFLVQMTRIQQSGVLSNANFKTSSGFDVDDSGVVSTSLKLNEAFASKLTSLTLSDFKHAYGEPTISGSTSKFTVTFPNLSGVKLYFYNKSGNNTAVDTVNSKPRNTARPTEIELEDLSLLFNGITQNMNYKSLKGMGISDARKSTDKSFGGYVILFTFNGAQMKIACDKDGNITKTSKNAIYPVAVGSETTVTETSTVIETVTVTETETETETTAVTSTQAAETTATPTTVTTTEPPTTEPPTEPEISVIYRTLRVTVTNALDGSAICGATVAICSTNTLESKQESASTDSSGTVTFTNVPTGDYSVSVYCDGYISVEGDSVYVSEGEDVTSKSVALSPPVQSGQIRIVLTWNEYPCDLDSHLVGTSSGGRSVHVYFGSRNASGVADLDCDDMSSYGPETITIDDVNGDYTYYVNDFTCSGEMALYGCTVSVYSGNSLVKTYSCPSSLSDPLNWYVCIISGGQIYDY